MQDLTKVEKKEKTMTVAEVANAFGVDNSTVRKHANKMGLTEKGKVTKLTEKDVTDIKMKIERSGRNDIGNVSYLPKTNLEKQLLIKQAMMLQEQMICELQEENDNLVEENTQLKLTNEELSYKSNFYDDFMNYGSNNIKIGDLAKTLSLMPSQLFTYMKDNKIIMRSAGGYSVFARYITPGYFVQKSKLTHKGNKTVVLVTPKGCAWIYKQLKDGGIL